MCFKMAAAAILNLLPVSIFSYTRLRPVWIVAVYIPVKFHKPTVPQLSEIQNGGCPPSWVIIWECWTNHKVFFVTGRLFKFRRANRVYFLLLARDVPNVAKRSIWEQCKKKYILRTDHRPTGDRRPTTDDRPTTSHLGNFKWPYLREGSSDPLHVWFYCGVFGVGGSNGTNTGKPRDAPWVTRCSQMTCYTRKPRDAASVTRCSQMTR